MAHDDNSSSKFLSLFQIDCLKPSMNQPVDRSEKLASLIPLALIDAVFAGSSLSKILPQMQCKKSSYKGTSQRRLSTGDCQVNAADDLQLIRRSVWRLL
jgi:hypothetical protein